MKKNQKILFFFLMIIKLFSVFCCVSLAENSAFLNPPPTPEQNSFYQKIKDLSYDDASYEKNKIYYLLDRVRNSTFKFIRNNKAFSAKKAALHLRWKLLRNRGEIDSAKEFIDYVATRSKMSGEYYMTEDESGKRQRLADLLKNELNLLEETLGFKNI